MQIPQNGTDERAKWWEPRHVDHIPNQYMHPREEAGRCGHQVGKLGSEVKIVVV